MNLFEFCARYHISQPKARRMYADGVLSIEPLAETLPAETAITARLARGADLTAAQLCQLVEDPALLDELGAYAGRAKAQLAALGKIEPAPRSVVAYVTDAAKNDPEAVNVLLGYLREIIPAQPVSHAYIAVRLLLGLAPNIRQYDIPRIPRALFNCKRRPEFANFWRLEKRGNRNVTLYCRPRVDALDL